MENDAGKTDLSSLRINHDKKHRDRPGSKKWWWLIWAFAAVIVALGYLQLREKLVPATPVQAALVQRLGGSDASAELVATGYVVAQRKAEVASKGTGRLVYLGFEEGDTVKTGEVIAQLDNDDIRASLSLAKAQLEQAKVDSLDKGRQYRRQKSLLTDGAVTDVQVEAAEAAYKNTLAAIAAAEASVRVAEVNLENTYIRAPFDGTVLTKNADVGEVVAPFASSSSSKGSVVTLADMSSLEVEADVSEANIHIVFIGQHCEIILDAYPNERYQSHVKKIVPTADRARATVLTKIAFDEIDEKVLPEMSARVNFFLELRDQEEETETAVITVTNEAITLRDTTELVFRIDGDYVTAVTVTTGRDLGNLTEILEGLNPGDQVVLSPPGKMRTGQKVKVSTY